MLNRTEIMEILPHRAPFLLLDRVLELGADRAVAQLEVRDDAFWVPGHFPDEPVMPGVLIVEAIAQCGAIVVLSRPEFKGQTAYFAKMDKVRFKRKVVPGETLHLEVELTRMRGSIGMGSGRALVDGALAATVEMTFAIGGSRTTDKGTDQT